MIPIETILLFILASAALGISPGPDNIIVFSQAVANGRRAGILVTFGLCTGLLVHTATVSLGIAAIFQTSPLAFTLLKIVGALYLLYLAWQAFNSNSTALEIGQEKALNWQKLYVRGIIMNVTNPKVAIFFLAFLPQFTNPSVGSVPLQMLLLGGLFILTTLVLFCGIAWFAGFLGQRLKKSTKYRKYTNRVVGSVFTALAVKLIISSH